MAHSYLRDSAPKLVDEDEDDAYNEYANYRHIAEEEEYLDKNTMDEYFKSAHDPVNHPSHYTSHPSGIETITLTEHESFCIGNAIKYLMRFKDKNGRQDLEKAIWYINREMERLYGK